MIVADRQFGRVHIRGLRLLAQPGPMDEEEQGHVHFLFKLYETGVGNGMGEVPFPGVQDALAIKVFEAFEPRIVIEDHDGHHFTGGHAETL